MAGPTRPRVRRAPIVTMRRRLRRIVARSWLLSRLYYRLQGVRLAGRPIGKAAPANLSHDPGAEVWGVLYRITRRDLLRLDSTEGVPGQGYRHIEIAAQDADGRLLHAVAYMAPGKETDGKPSLRYITLLRDGARAHGLPEHYVRYLESVEHAR